MRPTSVRLGPLRATERARGGVEPVTVEALVAVVAFFAALAFGVFLAWLSSHMNQTGE